MANIAFAGLLISIGFVLMENVGNCGVKKKDQSRGRKLLIMIWMVASFLISLCYMSVLLTFMVSTGYEKPIDTVQDLLITNKPIYIHSYVKDLMAKDPRESVRQIADKGIGDSQHYNNMSESMMQR